MPLDVCARGQRIAHPASSATTERPARSSSRWRRCCLSRRQRGWRHAGCPEVLQARGLGRLARAGSGLGRRGYARRAFSTIALHLLRAAGRRCCNKQMPCSCAGTAAQPVPRSGAYMLPDRGRLRRIGANSAVISHLAYSVHAPCDQARAPCCAAVS